MSREQVYFIPRSSCSSIALQASASLLVYLNTQFPAHLVTGPFTERENRVAIGESLSLEAKGELDADWLVTTRALVGEPK